MGQLKDLVIDVFTSLKDVREMDNDDNNDVQKLGTQKNVISC